MDPDANLNEQLILAARLLRDETPDLTDVVRLAELVESLHSWLGNGGALPAMWSSARGGR